MEVVDFLDVAKDNVTLPPKRLNDVVTVQLRQIAFDDKFERLDVILFGLKQLRYHEQQISGGYKI